VGLAIEANEGDWGGAQLSDIEAVARSAADSFGALDDDEVMAITLEPTASEDDPPRTLSGTGPGRSVVRLNIRGNLWARLAYQFGHEYCHVLADPTTRSDKATRFTWIEEALCETGSLFALRSMAKRWAINPPYPIWREYSASLAAYEAEHVSHPMRSLPLGATFSDWLSDRLPLLEADPYRRDDNTIIAKELLRVFETEHAVWRAVRYLHAAPLSAEASLARFMNDWVRICPAECRRGVESVAELIDSGEDPRGLWSQPWSTCLVTARYAD
jgi:hypothetical protein